MKDHEDLEMVKSIEWYRSVLLRLLRHMAVAIERSLSRHQDSRKIGGLFFFRADRVSVARTEVTDPSPEQIFTEKKLF